MRILDVEEPVAGAGISPMDACAQSSGQTYNADDTTTFGARHRPIPNVVVPLVTHCP
ncbi:MAG: hypothetical protein M3R24_35600 [Chloroflexota bacterium]|nr:hypothetical protein [Chloroflexota bacterium]